MSHNRAYVALSPGHFRTFQVQYEDDGGYSRVKSFKTQDEAEVFYENLGPTRTRLGYTEKRFRRIMQIDHVDLTKHKELQEPKDDDSDV